MYTKIKTEKEIEAMRRGGHICARILALLKQNAQPGISTKELANIAKNEIKLLGARPAFLNYSGFPEVVCISINDEIVHGIPKQEKILNSDDIVSFDLGITFENMIVDSAISVLVKSNDKTKNNLLFKTEEALFAGIEQIHDNCHVGDISHAVQKVLKKEKYGIVRDLVGHGVGHEVHEEPNIPNFGKAKTGPVLKTGMTIAVEPMATLGTHEIYIDNDGWTVKSKDGSLSAHFEHTILVTNSGYEILTR